MLTRHLTSSPMSPPSFAFRVAPILAITLGTCPTLSKPLPAQSVGGEWATLHRFDGPTYPGKMGYSVSDAGDVNGDGHTDLIMGANIGNIAYVHSGLDGSLLWELRPDPVDLGEFGFCVSGAGDVNADGYADLVVGAPFSDARNGTWRSGSAYIFSGLDGSLLFRFDGTESSDSFGISTASAGDVNRDGHADILLVAPGAGPFGSTYVYSGFDGSLYFQLSGSANGFGGGIEVAGAEDINGDSYPDLIVGAPGAPNGSYRYAGMASVFSGYDGSLLLQFRGPASDYQLGGSVAFAGDVNLDGTPDLIIGAWASLGYTGSAFVYSGSDGGILYEFSGGSTFDAFGYSVDGVGDVDRDGFPDFIIGAFRANEPGGAKYDSGSAYVYSGRDGKLLFRFDGEENYDDLGYSVSGMGDVDGDGYPEMLVGAPRAEHGGLGNQGAVYVIGIDPFLTTDANTLSATTGPHVNLSLDFPATEGGFSYVLLLSATGIGPTNLNGVDIPLTADNMFNRMLTGWAPPVLPNAFGTLDLNGDADVLAVSHPYLTPFIGQTYYAAAVSFDPVGLVPRLSSVVRSAVIVP